MDEQSTNKKQYSGCMTLFAAIMFVCIIVGAALLYLDHANKNPQETGKFFSRPATRDDIVISAVDSLSSRYTFKMIPSEDIDSLEIEFQFCDKDGEVIITKNKYIGNVVKGSEYSIFFWNRSLPLRKTH